jgi:hypothetical protein
MKIELCDKLEPKKFIPVRINITIDTIEEARLLFHVLNRADLKKIIFKNYGTDGEFSNKVADEFDSKAYMVVEKLIKEQGFEI